MKTAAIAQRSSSEREAAKGGGSSRKPFFSAPARARDVQTRLQMGCPGDRFELEADRVADRVVEGKPARHGQPGLAAGITPLTQRAAQDKKEVQAQAEDKEEQVQARIEEEEEEEVQAKAEEEKDIQPRSKEKEEENVQAQAEEEKDIQPRSKEKEEENVQAQAEEEKDIQPKPGKQGEEDKVQARAEEEEEPLQARASQPEGLSASDDVARQVRAARGLGNPLPGAVREKMAAQFGADFSGIRIHTDAAAVLLANALKAQAFTRGNDIFFNEGKFAPSSRAGEHLLAHELTHTVQQGAVEAAQSPGDADIVRLAPDNGAETYEVRPEIVEAIRLARGEIGKVNAKKAGGDGKRIGWERLREYFKTALGGPVISEHVIERITYIEKSAADGRKKRMDALPSWCGIFTWWAMKKADIPIPDWKLGAPALDAMKRRPAGELPHKGDIAIDVQPYNHFAMVTGLESAKDAEGKPVKLTRIATVNGNTSGEDNLGGQIQEKWNTLSHWDFFFDPVGKLKLPGVPLVTVGREPGEAEAGPPAAPPTEAEKEAAAAGPRPGVTALETGVAAPEAEAFGAPLPEPDLSLPPPVAAGPAEKVAKVETADLAGTSDQATTKFMDTGPSVMAATQRQLGPAIDGKMKAEQRDLADNPPVLEARTSGVVDAPITGPENIPIPGGTPITDGVQGADPGSIDPVAAPTPAPFRDNVERNEQLDKEDSGSFRDAFKNFLRKFTTGIRTRDDSIDTSAGKSPTVALEGEASTSRMETQRQEGTTAVKARRDAQTKAFRNHPGQKNIQPRKLDEQRPAAVSAKPAADIEAQEASDVHDYAEAPLPADVRSAADAKIAAKLTPNLADARSQTTAAATSRDSDKKREVDTAQAAASQLNSETDAAQRKLVMGNRGKVAKLQGEGIGSAYEHVNAFARDATKEQTARRNDIGDHVKSEEGKAKQTLDKGEKDADKEKLEGERKAAAKKKELEKEQDKGSWWDRVKSAIKKAVKAITDAIDAVFTAVRNVVKTIVEKAKNAAIGLINAARNWVVDKLNKFRDWAKSQVDKYLKGTFPGLAKRINAGIDAVTDTAIKGVNAVADAAIAGINKLANALAAALDKILATFQTALKTAVRVVGAVLQGDFAEALRAAIEGACEIAGVEPKPVFDFLDRAGKAIKSILKAPVKFIKNLFSAVGAGISSFFKNIKKHLIQGVIGWLTGALSEVNITGPFEFTPKGILRIVLQILGLTYASIKARVIKKVPAAAKVFDVVEKGFALLKKLVAEGPGALWEVIRSKLASLKEMVMGAIRNWLITTVIKEGIVWLLSLTNPASAIVKAIKLLFDLVMFLVERYQQIKDFILSVYHAVAAVAAGSFAKVSKAVENALSRVLPVLISLLASILGLGGIAKQVKKVIQAVTRPINKVINKVIDNIVKFAKKVLAKLRLGAKKVKQKAGAVAKNIFKWWKARKPFSARNGERHSLFFAGKSGSATLMIQSKKQRYAAFIHSIKIDDSNSAQKTAKNNALAVARKIDSLRRKMQTSAAGVKDHTPEFNSLLDELAQHTAIFMKREDGEIPTTTPPAYGGLRNGFATSMKVDILSKIGPPGTSVKVKRPEMDLLLKRRSGNGSYYIAGHLLNNNLHGPGTTWQNLTPLTRGANAQHERDVESKLKGAILNSNDTKARIFTYSVVPQYGRSENQAAIPVFLSSTSTFTKKALKAQIASQERAVPTGLNCSWQELDKQTRKPKGQTFAKLVPNHIETDPKSYVA